MQWDDGIDLTKLKMTSRLIVERALHRGWKVCSFKTNSAIMLMYPEGRETPIQIFSASPPHMSYPASKIANDKYITNQILAYNDLPVPRENLVKVEGEDKINDQELQKYLSEYTELVVKPLDASHGKGITTNVDSLSKLKAALVEARMNSKKKTVLIQEQIKGVDIRIVCINYKFADAISRIPANVKGDGESTVKELVDITNTNGERGKNYKTALNTIPTQKAIQYLSEAKLNEIPNKDTLVQVIGVSNTGMGGVLYNIKYEIPDFLISIAEKAACVLELPVCGVDFMVSHLPKKHNTVNDLNMFIIEANSCPSLVMHNDLHSHDQISLLDRYLDYINKS